MRQEHLKIENIPAILWGEASEKVYLVVHGKCGSKEEAEGFANVVVPKGWQVLSIDKRLHMQLTVIEEGEHWLHTQKELEILKNWQEENTK